ncbi:hypothetical protein HDU79_007154 [Rhizoclosmatium sp. JEL0117]|nr:hypothetical protein HDU79_007154 [Rhizoclosmatium sp. JEL0117]
MQPLPPEFATSIQPNFSHIELELSNEVEIANECVSDEDLDTFFSPELKSAEMFIPAVQKASSIGNLISKLSSFWSKGRDDKEPIQAEYSTPLPMELMLEVTSHVETSQRKELYALLSVNKRWNNATANKFWKRIHITDDTKWKYFEETCLVQFKLAACYPFKTQMPQLHPYAQLIHSLRISNLSNAISASNWIEIIKSCPQLEELILENVSVEPFSSSDLQSPITPVSAMSLPNSPSLFRRNTQKSSTGIAGSSVSMPVTPRIRRAATNIQNPANIIEMDEDESLKLSQLNTLQISWSPDLHIDSLLTVVFHARSIRNLSLAGIHTLLEADLCKVLEYLPDLQALSLGNLKSTRAAFSSSRGLGTFKGSMLATQLAKTNKNITSINLHGLVNLSTEAFAALLFVTSPKQPGTADQVENEPTQLQTQSLPNLFEEAQATAASAEIPSTLSRNVRLTHIGLHSSTSHIADAALYTTLTSPLVISNLTHFSLSESHTMTDASFVGIIRAMSEHLRVLEIGPGLNLNEVSVSSVGQLCTNLQSFTCIGLGRCADVGIFVGHRFHALETLILKDMKALTEVRQLVIPPRKMSAWREMVVSVISMETENEVLENETETTFEEEDEELEFHETEPYLPSSHNMETQADENAIEQEVLAAENGLEIPDPEAPVIIGCIALKRLQLIGCPSLVGNSIAKIVKAVNRTVAKIQISEEMMDDESRIEMIDIFPQVEYI